MSSFHTFTSIFPASLFFICIISVSMSCSSSLFLIFSLSAYLFLSLSVFAVMALAVSTDRVIQGSQIKFIASSLSHFSTLMSVCELVYTCSCDILCCNGTYSFLCSHGEFFILRINVLLYPEGQQVSCCHTVTGKDRRQLWGRLMVETMIDSPMVWIISERRWEKETVATAARGKEGETTQKSTMQKVQQTKTLESQHQRE